jgi:predicted short-subunit dehydrogenase-like oxidoreductase (DUF2520 family)
MSFENQISIIGSGNVAQQLAPALKRCGYTIREICSRNEAKGKLLARQVQASYSKDISKVEDAGGTIIIAVKDDAIAEVISKLPSLKNSLVIHTSGATDISVLKKKFKNSGVLWQVQTIQARTKVDFKKVPLVIEANNFSSKQNLKKLAQSLSKKVYPLNSHQRRVLHLGAVFVNNFPNHLYYLSEMLLKKHQMPFELFGPLILSTAENGIKDPKTAQTGPAKRKDKKTMQAHLKLLPDKNYRNLYKMLSKSIINLYN